MRILVNALSATHLSGRYVLLGHVRQLAVAASRDFHIGVVHHPENTAVVDQSPLSNVEWLLSAGWAKGTFKRTLWETMELDRMARSWRADVILNPAGTITANCRTPQVSLTQNPWPMTPLLHRGFRDRVKARLQRRAFRSAMRNAAAMLFNSKFMQEAYHRVAGGPARGREQVVYQGVEDSMLDQAILRRDASAKVPGRILAVSAMANWKGIETLVAALPIVRCNCPDAHLYLVGPWPDPTYRDKIELEIKRHGVSQHVVIMGMVDRAELEEHYRVARVFSLLSYCESFGIPALEAQAFATPAVVSTGCAMPEVCGAGGWSTPPGDAESAARLLTTLLTDEAQWQKLSQAAAENVERFRWPRCSAPLVELMANLF